MSFKFKFQKKFLFSLLLGGLFISFADADSLSSIKEQFKRPTVIPFPQDNPYTPEKAALGKMLFFDPRLSRDQNFNCASCHNPSFGWEVPLAKAIGAGAKPLERQAPTVLNHAWGNAFFWDGRAKSLEEQAKGPIQSPFEMALPLNTAVERLNKLEGYRRAFTKAFPKEGLTTQTILKAISTYERTLISGEAPFDRWIKGDEQAMSSSAKRGFSLFIGKARCILCHYGWRLTDDQFHDIGSFQSLDQGRYKVTHNPKDMYAMKTPSLREIAQRAPYMHDGSLQSLEAVIIHYVTGGKKRATLSPLMQPIALNPAEIQDLIDFMKNLSSKNTQPTLPTLPSY